MRRLAVCLTLCLLAARPAAAQCGGTERWAVKVGADPTVSTVDVANPIATLLHDLVTIPRPQIPHDDVTRVAEERNVRVVDARLVKFKVEAGKKGDQDFHLVISDDTLLFSTAQASPHSFVAEIVNPACVGGRQGNVPTPSRFQSQLASVRTKFLQQFPNVDMGGSWNDAEGIPVRLTGVEFFDREHGQTGRSPFGLELHPLLDIAFPGNVPVPPPPSLLQNPGFENGSQGWTSTANVISTDASQPAHTGSGKAWFGGLGEVHTDRLSQNVTLPSTATAVSVTFFLRVSTEEQTTTTAFDTLRVQVRDGAGHVKTIGTFSNLQASSSYIRKTFNLTAYKGQSIRLQLVATEDKSAMTSFVVDDFVIVIE